MSLSTCLPQVSSLRERLLREIIPYPYLLNRAWAVGLIVDDVNDGVFFQALISLAYRADSRRSGHF
jgi:hypothetical protein